MKKILITGSSGFIGNELFKYFESKKYDTYGIDVFCNTKSNNRFVINLVDYESVKNSLNEIKPDIIIHCAGNASVPSSVEQPLVDLERNVVVTETMLFAIKELKLDTRFVLLSSASVYGNQTKMPIKEDAELKPVSPYAIHKLFCENLCLFYKENYDVDTKIVRIFSAYGSGLKKQIFWDMSEKIRLYGKLEMGGTGDETRDFIHVKDILNALEIVSLTKNPEIIYNVASGNDITIKTIAQTFARLNCLDSDLVIFTGSKRSGDPLRMQADISLLKQLGFNPSINIEDGLSDYVKWYKDNKKIGL